MALRLLLDLEKEVGDFAARLGLTRPFVVKVNPGQLFGIEINEYAHELAQVTVWIGYIQWRRDNGFGDPTEPILKPLHNIRQMDAILALDAEGQPVEPEWPEADVIVGNPPFLGDKKMRAEMGDEYVEALRGLYAGRVPGGADLVTYWFEKARAYIEGGKVKRAGLLATNSIRSGANRVVLDRVKAVGEIFWAQSDREWVLDGAAVRVSMVGFDDGQENDRALDGKEVATINSDLSSRPDVTRAVSLSENDGICYLGMMKAGPFDIDDKTARQMLAARGNPNGRPNSDVVRPRVGGQDVTGRRRDTWIVDFDELPEEDAAKYELPFEYVREHVKPVRASNRRERTRTRWWIFGESRPGLRKAIQGLRRVLVTPEVSKHRLFIWINADIVPDQKLHVFARADDYFLGVLQSRLHELWSLAQGSWMGVGNDPSYPSTTIRIAHA